MCAEEQHNTIWVMGKLCYSATQWPTFMYWHRHCAEHCETRTMKCPQTISIKYRNKTAFCTCRTHEKEIVYWSMACIHQSPVSSRCRIPCATQYRTYKALNVLLAVHRIHWILHFFLLICVCWSDRTVTVACQSSNQRSILTIVDRNRSHRTHTHILNEIQSPSHTVLVACALSSKWRPTEV